MGTGPLRMVNQMECTSFWRPRSSAMSFSCMHSYMRRHLPFLMANSSETTPVHTIGGSQGGRLSHAGERVHTNLRGLRCEKYRQPACNSEAIAARFSTFADWRKSAFFRAFSTVAIAYSLVAAFPVIIFNQLWILRQN